MSAAQIITTAISLAALCLSIFNFSLARRADKKKNELQKRNDRRELMALLNRADALLFGVDGFAKTADNSKFQDASGCVAEALLIDANDSDATRYDGVLKRLQGDIGGARKSFERAIRLNPASSRARRRKASTLRGA
jgi:tetratricopeptide (TPR) repeat protein